MGCRGRPRTLSGFFWCRLSPSLGAGRRLAPTLKKSSPNGLDETPEAFGPFKPEAELTNGRGATVGLVSLLVVEHFTKGALFGFFFNQRFVLSTSSSTASGHFLRNERISSTILLL